MVRVSKNQFRLELGGCEGYGPTWGQCGNEPKQGYYRCEDCERAAGRAMDAAMRKYLRGEPPEYRDPQFECDECGDVTEDIRCYPEVDKCLCRLCEEYDEGVEQVRGDESSGFVVH